MWQLLRVGFALLKLSWILEAVGSAASIDAAADGTGVGAERCRSLLCQGEVWTYFELLKDGCGFSLASCFGFLPVVVLV